MRKFGVTILQNLQPRWNLAPSQQALVISRNGLQNEAMMAQWGMPPASAKHSFLINARSETVQDKPTFREAFHHRRCLVVASGWYEWSALKTPWHIQLYDGGVMAFGGLLYGQADQQRFVILTTAADAGLADIHHRAPLTLAPEDYDVWMAGDAETASRLLRPWSMMMMRRLMCLKTAPSWRKHKLSPRKSSRRLWSKRSSNRNAK